MSSYKIRAPRRAGSQVGVGLRHVIYKEVLRAGSAKPREENAWGLLLVATTETMQGKGERIFQVAQGWYKRQ